MFAQHWCLLFTFFSFAYLHTPKNYVHSKIIYKQIISTHQLPTVKNRIQSNLQYKHMMMILGEAALWAAHSGLQLSLNLSLFLQTSNAISESEYVKIGSMCIFFSWFQWLVYQKIQLYTFLGSNLSHVSYQLGKGCCLPTFPQYFAHNLYNAFVAQW